MALTTAWAVGGGAENTVEGARRAQYAATQGARGVILPSDMKVSALPVPGPFVRIASGGCTTPNTYQGGGGQAYSMAEEDHTDFPVAPTGSAAAAVKYLVARIEDDQYEGEDKPASDPRNKYEWVSTLNGLPFPYVELARLNQPKNTAAITPAMITDLRQVANPKKDYGYFSRPRIMADDGPQVKLTSRWKNGNNNYWGELFPGGDGIPNQGTIFLPEWANYMVITATWTNVSAAGGQNAYGRRWIEFGDQYKAHTWPDGRQYEFATEQFGFDTSGAGSSYSTDWTISDKVYIPAKLRGKNVTFAFKAGLNDGASTSGITMKALGGLALRADYTQQAVDDNTI